MEKEAVGRGGCGAAGRGVPGVLAPVGYAVGRGWMSTWIADLYVTPIVGVFGQPGRSAPATALRNYAQWWGDLGARHRA